MARVTVDGVEVIRARQKFYDAPPGWLHFGRAPGRPERGFSGAVSDVRRLPPRSKETVLGFTESGVWRFEFDVPPITQTAGQPLLSSGQTGAGNLLFLEVLSASSFRFGLDTWGWLRPVRATSSLTVASPVPSASRRSRRLASARALNASVVVAERAMPRSYSDIGICQRGDSSSVRDRAPAAGVRGRGGGPTSPRRRASAPPRRTRGARGTRSSRCSSCRSRPPSPASLAAGRARPARP